MLVHDLWGHRMWKSLIISGCVGIAIVTLPAVGLTGDQSAAATKTEHFDKDPDWEGFNNRVELKKAPTVTQDFGYSATQFAGDAKGEVGGRIQRAAKPAYYADKIGVKTLNDKLTASGTFALTATSANGGLFFGWFNAQQPDDGGRPMNSLGLDFDGEKGGARLAVRMISGTNRSCGTFVTPFIPGKFRPTPIRNDGTRYSWTLSYDPEANGGNGQFQFTIKSHGNKPEELDAKNLPADMPESYKQEALSRFPNTTTFVVDVPPELRKAGATFDHFGLMNMMKPGKPLTIYFGDLERDGKKYEFANDAGWDGVGNRISYEGREQVGAQLWFQSGDESAGGTPGEIGGVLWRGGNYSYYADRVGPISLNDRLEAHGKVVLKSGRRIQTCFWAGSTAQTKTSPPRKPAVSLASMSAGRRE